RDVGDTDGTVGGIDVLATGTRGAIGIDTAVALVDLDLDRVVDHRVDANRGKGSVTPRIGVERRDANQAMNAGFRLQPAVGVVPLDLIGRRLDARLFAFMDFESLHL